MQNSPGALTLRLAQVQDAGAMASMSRALIEVGLGWRYTAPRMNALIHDAETVALVACDGPHVEAFAVMRFGDETAHLILLCVRPRRQRQGVGRRLIAWLVESARVAGMASIQVELRAGNAPASAFYRRLGFVETELLAGYYAGEFAARRMVRTLGPDEVRPAATGRGS
jgi:[ribosomal protein S18]-alanine N-acetyltransferase